ASRRRHTRLVSDWSSDVCSSDLRKCSQPNTIQHLHGQVRQVRCTHTHPRIYTWGPTARPSPLRTSDTPGRISPEKGPPRKGTSTTEGSTTTSLPRPQRAGI